jgi:hypothetical protein
METPIFVFAVVVLVPKGHAQYRILGTTSLTTIRTGLIKISAPRPRLSSFVLIACSGAVHRCPCGASYKFSTFTKSWTTWKSHDPAGFKIQPWQHGRRMGRWSPVSHVAFLISPRTLAGRTWPECLNRALEVGFDFWNFLFSGQRKVLIG